MNPDRWIVRTHRRSDSITTISDEHNTLTCQSADTNDAPRDPHHGPVTWNPDWTWPYSSLWLRLHLRLSLCLRLRLHLCLQSVTITASTVLLCQEPAHNCIRYVMLAPSLASAVPCWQPFLTGFDSPVFWLDSTPLFFDLIRLKCFSIWLYSLVFLFD